MKTPKIKILVVSHKEFPVINDDIYQPILVGEKISKITLPKNWIGDDTGENISHKNKEYAEITAIYWAWKNYKKLGNPDYIGLCHYRRYFYPLIYDLKNFLKKFVRFFMWLGASTLPQYISKECCFDPLMKISFNRLEKNKEKIKKKLRRYLKKYDVITPKNVLMSKFTLREQYERYHIKEDLEIAVESILNIYPEYKKEIKKVLNGKKFIPTNMFIMKKEIFFEYCRWLFIILKESEKRIKISGYDYQRRVFGFLAERLFNIWLENNKRKLRIKKIKTSLVVH